MKFLADENVEKSVVDMLRNLGHDMFYVCEIASRSIDEQLLQQANLESRIKNILSVQSAISVYSFSILSPPSLLETSRTPPARTFPPRVSRAG